VNLQFLLFLLILIIIGILIIYIFIPSFFREPDVKPIPIVPETDYKGRI